MPKKLEGQVAVVTGSDSGIGRAIAIEFAREGASVAVNYYDDKDGAEKTKAEIEKQGGRAVIIQADVASEKDVENLFDKCGESLGVPSILVNNAGIDSSGKHVADMDLATWKRTLDVNATGPFLCCRRFLKDVRSNGNHGKIINITSVHEDIPRAGAAEYCASKGALRNLTRCLTLELAEDRINVNNIAPGMVLTPMNQDAIDNPRVLEEQVESIPFKRAAEPSEIAKLALYLASHESDYAAGSTFFIDGGLMQNLGQGA